MTKTKSRRRVILPFTTLALVCAAPAVLAAPLPRSATVEVVEVDAKGARSAVRFTLALDSRRPSELDTSVDRTSYRLWIAGEHQRPPATLVELRLTRVRSSKDHGGDTIKLSVRGRVAPGKRVVLGRIARPGGREVQVAVTLT